MRTQYFYGFDHLDGTIHRFRLKNELQTWLLNGGIGRRVRLIASSGNVRFAKRQVELGRQQWPVTFG